MGAEDLDLRSGVAEGKEYRVKAGGLGRRNVSGACCGDGTGERQHTSPSITPGCEGHMIAPWIPWLDHTPDGGQPPTL